MKRLKKLLMLAIKLLTIKESPNNFKKDSGKDFVVYLFLQKCYFRNLESYTIFKVIFQDNLQTAIEPYKILEINLKIYLLLLDLKIK